MLARAGPDVDDVVRDADGLLVVLDHDDRVAEVAQALERRDEAPVVALVQADRGLVEHVEHADQAAADLAGQADALGLAARERAAERLEREVVEADVDQELEPLADLLHDLVGDQWSRSVRSRSAEAVDGLADGEAAQLGDVLPPTVTARTRA